MVDPETGQLVPRPGYRPVTGTIESGLPFAGAVETGETPQATEGEPTAPGKLSFEEWLDATGSTKAWLEGNSAVQTDIWDGYKAYLSGEEVGLEGAAAGAAAPLLSPQEERTLIDLEKAIKVGEMDEDQAWNILEQYWNRETVQTVEHTRTILES